MYSFLKPHKKDRIVLSFVALCFAMFLGVYLTDANLSRLPSFKSFDPLGAAQAHLEHLVYFFQTAATVQHLLALAPPAASTTTTGFATSIPVLVYHGIITRPDGYNVTASDFAKQMTALKNSGWQTVSLSDFVAFVRGQKKIPAHSLLLTFDDGRKDTYLYGDPVLEALGFRATMLLITGRVDTTAFYLTSADIKDMQGSLRWDFGSHTRNSHGQAAIDSSGTQGYILSNKLYLVDQGRLETDLEYQSRITADLQSSKDDLLSKWGVTAAVFAYPFGDFGQGNVTDPHLKDILTAVVSREFPYNFIQTWFGAGGYFNAPVPLGGMVRRLAIDKNWTAKQLTDTLAVGSDKEIPFLWAPQDTNLWLHGWGNLTVQNGLLTLTSTDSTTGSEVALVGDSSWANYSFSALLKIPKGKSFALTVGRTQDQSYSCVFATDGISLTAQNNDASKTLSSLSLATPLPRDTFQLATVDYAGNFIHCSLGGHTYISYRFPDPLIAGGIGISVYDPVVGNAQLDISRVQVTRFPL